MKKDFRKLKGFLLGRFVPIRDKHFNIIGYGRKLCSRKSHQKFYLNNPINVI
jgi:hypothetical protein